MMLRAIAVVVALCLLGATAHAVITHAGGYGTPHAYTTIALAAGVAVGALTIGAAWDQGRRLLAVVLCIALACGEAFGLLSTAERLVAQRDAMQAPVADAHAQRAAAAKQLAKAEAELVAVSRSDRVQRAEAAKTEADRAAVAKSAERGCVANCRALLEQQVKSAEAELSAARAEVAQRVATANANIATARAALAGLKAPASVTPLADRLGVAGWSLDLIAAALGSLAANGLAAALLVFAAHRRSIDTASPVAPVAAEGGTTHHFAPRQPLPVLNIAEHAARFGVECLTPKEGGKASLEAIKARYLAWCSELGVSAVADGQIGKALADLFAAVGLRAIEQDGRIFVVGIEIKPSASPMLTHAAPDFLQIVPRQDDEATSGCQGLRFASAT